MTQIAFRDRAGQMRERVVFQRRGPDVNGDPLGAWADQFTAWAHVTPLLTGGAAGLRRGEVTLQDRIAGAEALQATIRVSTFTGPLDNTWRFVWRGMGYDIRSVGRDERGAFLTVLGEAINPNTAP